jgi:hypothetical protein
MPHSPIEAATSTSDLFDLICTLNSASRALVLAMLRLPTEPLARAVSKIQALLPFWDGELEDLINRAGGERAVGNALRRALRDASEMSGAAILAMLKAELRRQHEWPFVLDR